jgi:hypothetical protein
MKTSRYNLYLQDSTGMVIYNAKSDEIVALTPGLANIFEEKKNVIIKSCRPCTLNYVLIHLSSV